MANPGMFNKLKVTRSVAAGIYVDAGKYGELMLPGWDVTVAAETGSEIDVFLFSDPEGRMVASMRRPLAMPGEAALLKVGAVTASGALLEWGMPKNLFVPLKEQAQKMVKGFSYVVYVNCDRKTGTITGSSLLEKFLTTTPGGLALNQEVELLICDESELGYRAVINHTGLGFLYRNDLFRSIKIGEKTTGFVKNIREDGRVDLYLQKPGYEKIIDIGDQVYDKLRSAGGFLAVTDKSSPEEISALFGTSKKNYKKAVGGLYKKGLISIEETGIRIVAEPATKKK
ncbi:MAG TPA: S1-like domain-containing RNA-binding protein [Candidatus Rifleibacterium sp.]|nr:S1-like domain-containing RNA-binding protein [Candidatus Rifleibacterium sp.]HPT47828.1 S1-like domain-containing RNA-binding protein [Candidatus Rifleibacterium sp.]